MASLSPTGDFSAILDLLTDNSQEVIYLYDSNQHLLYVSPSYKILTGYSVSSLQRKHFINCFHPEDCETMLKTWDQVFHGERYSGQFRYVTKQKAVKWCSASWKPFRDSRGRQIGVVRKEVDITERKLIEAALRDSEEKYRTILENIEDGYYDVDIQGNFIAFNDSMCRILGYPQEEMLGMNYHQFTDKENAKKVFKTFNEVYRTGKTAKEFDWQVIRKDGTKRYIEVSVSLQKNSSGKPIGFQGVSRDITERKQAENALAEREARYKRLLTSISDYVYTVEIMDGLPVRTVHGAGCEAVTGYVPDDFQADPYLWYRMICEEDRASVIQYAADVISGKAGPFLEHRIIHHDGSIRWVRNTSVPHYDKQGRMLSYDSVIMDITERKRAEALLRTSEEKYRTILEIMGEGYWENDLKGTFTFVNDAACRMDGYGREELVGMNYRKLYSPETARKVREVFKKIYETGEPAFMIDTEVPRKDGSVRIHESNAALLRDPSGKPIGFRNLVRDVTERKKAEEEKANIEKQLYQAQKMEAVSSLAGGVAHDFNNMLTVILGYTELIKSRLPQDDSLLNDILEIEKAAGRSKELTRQLLVYSRKEIIAPKPIDLNDLIVGSEKTASRLLGEDIELQFYPGKDIWKIKFDPSQLMVILINLVSNARDAMPKGGKLTIETENIQLNEEYCRVHLGFLPGDYVLLGVSDNGIGMDKETMQHVFEPFFTTKETGKGTGLGLATVYGIIKQNGGFINVYSEPGKGTTFKMYIPRSLEEGEVKKEAEEVLITSGTGTVLLVEDEDMVRKITTEMLEAIGYTTLSIGSPMEALSLFKNDDTHVDLVITDMVMPQMSGKELSDRIKAMRPGVKVLFMSGYSTNVIADQGVLVEGVHFIQKPFGMNDLARKVHDAIKDK